MTDIYDHVVYKSYIDEIKTKVLAAADDNLPVTDPYGDYMIRAMIILMLAIEKTSENLKKNILDPSKLFDGVNQKLTDFEKIIARFTAKYGNGGTPTDEEIKEFLGAIKGFQDAVEELRKGIPTDDEGNPIEDSDQYKVWKEAKAELDAILNAPVNEGHSVTYGEYINGGRNIDAELRRGLRLSSQANSSEPPQGVFAKWINGTSNTPHQGFDHFGTKLNHLLEEYLDEAGKMTTLIKTANDVTANIIKTAHEVNMAKIRGSKQL